MAAGDTLQKISLQENLIFDASGNLVGIKNPHAFGADLNVTSLVSGAVNSRTVASIGDSFPAREFLTVQISAAVVAAGVMTVTAAGHTLQYNGQRVSIAGFAVAGANVFAAAATRIDVNQFSVPVPGVPDGALSIGTPVPFVQILGQPRNCSALRQFCKRSGKFTAGPNLGRPGHTTAELVAAGVAGRLSGKYAGILVDISGANSLSRYSALSDADWLVGEQIAYQALVTMLLPYTDYIHIIGPAAFTASYSGASAGNIARLNSLNTWLAAWCASRGYKFTNRRAITTDGSGYALTGYTINNDWLHSTEKQASVVGAQVLLDCTLSTSRKTLRSSPSDTYSVTPTSQNLFPAFGYASTGGAGGAGTSGQIVSGAAVVRGAGTATAVCSAIPRSDSNGFLQRMVVTGAPGDVMKIRLDGNAAVPLTLANASALLTTRWVQSVTGATGVLRGVYVLLTVTVDAVPWLIYLNNATSFANVNEVGIDETLSIEEVTGTALPAGPTCTLFRFELIVEFAASGGQGGSGGTVTVDFGSPETDY